MMDKKNKVSCGTSSSGKFLIALLFILSGMLLFARNVGWVGDEWFDVIVSWHSLLIILGIYSLLRRHYVGGIILLLIGGYFLIGGLSWLPENSQAMVWPLALILVGVLFLFKTKRRRPNLNLVDNQPSCQSEDGFLRSDNAFGAARHVVLDELFKGAIVRNSFGGTTIDLRHTHLAAGETYIDLDCNCGGIELYVPSDWKVAMKCNAFFGGCEDKRWKNGNVDKERTLVIRGKISFGGLEIKD